MKLFALAGGILVAAPLVAQAGGIVDFDARALAMGGTGVATANAGSAAAYNPAMLSLQTQNTHAYLVLPALGAELYQQDDVLNKIDDIQKHNLPALTSDVDAVNGITLANAQSAQSKADYQQLANDVTALNSALVAINDRNVIANIGADLSFAVPGPDIGVAARVGGTAQIAGNFNYASSDQTAVSHYISAASDGAQGNTGKLATDCLTYTDIFTTTCQLKSPDQIGVNNQGLQSSANLRGVAVSNAGVSLSHGFQSGDTRLAVGITPEVQIVDTFGYTQTVNSSNGVDINNVKLSQYRKQYSNLNLDLGAAAMLNEQWSAGLDIKNLFGKSYETVNGYAIDVKPQASAGLGYRLKYLTLATDLDLSKNDMLHAGDATQYLSLGAEGDLLHWLQLRAGFRHNLVSSNAKDVFTAGVGLSPFNVLHIDIAGLVASNSVGGVLQLGLSF